ncbi:EAL domain-containing protein [Aliivibrio fischeri]|uniref:EAL domain-containing protein n=1 Tax=Aliivibrio fischeri TaxID=668 RepID=UPI0012DA69CF|nr:EAL domain-containing protein [Aliivibrio fischeri]MUL12328.1 EAL domain-containing protein [Aliivibrio fischeri]
MKQLNIWTLKNSLIFSLKIFFAILISYFLSYFFSIQFENYQVISFVVATMVVCFIRYDRKAAPAIFVALGSYYLYSGRDLSTSLILAVTIPLVPYLIIAIFNRFRKSNRSISSLLSIYFFLFGLLFPLLNSATFLAISYVTEKQHISVEFLVYSMLGSSVTLLTLAPLLILCVELFRNRSRKNHVKFDREIRSSKPSDISFKLWLVLSLVPLLCGFVFANNIELTFICLIVFMIIAAGIGKHGLLLPLAISTLTSLVINFVNIDRVNTQQQLDSNFYGFQLIMLIIIMLGYRLAYYVLRNHEIMQDKISSERLDPYTGLFNMTQLKDDIKDKDKVVLIYLNLTPTLSKIGDIGHEGKTLLIQQLQEQLNNFGYIERCYRPPFSLGILGFCQQSDMTQDQFKKITDYLDSFQFYRGNTSIGLVDPTLHCINVSNDMSIEHVISHLCDQPCLIDTPLNWVEAPLLEEQVSKLSYIQNIFKNDLFELNCQPYCNLTDKNSKQHSFEVLVRVKLNEGDVLHPSEFFPLIGQFGLETRLDQWVVYNTFKLLNENVVDWEKISKCAINLTAKSLGNPSLAKNLLLMADKFHIPLSKICFEITESSALQNEQQAIDTICTLRKAGAKIALDDFGTGYASFSYLRRLPLDILKIDGEFIKDLPNNEIDRLIVSSISSVAKELALETVAEFVETSVHMDILEELDITYAQGYGIAKPRPLVDFLSQINGQ